MKEKRTKTWLRKLVLMALCLTLTVISVPCPAQAADSDSKLEVTFLDVGQADAALIQCDGHSMLIDGGNAADSSKMYTVMKNHKITELDYVIGTHAHEDHIGGLAGALNYASVKTAYSPVTTYDSKAFQNFRKAVEKHGVSLTVPKRTIPFLWVVRNAKFWQSILTVTQTTPLLCCGLPWGTPRSCSQAMQNEKQSRQF